MIHLFFTAVLCLELIAGVPTPQTQSSINEVKRMIASINQTMPVDVEDFYVYQRIEYDAKASSVIFHMYVDEEMEGDLGMSEDEKSEHAAVMIAFAKYSSEVRETLIKDIGQKEFNALGKDHPEVGYILKDSRFFEKIGPFLDYLYGKAISITVRLRSKDGYSYDLFLSPGDVAFVVKNAEEIMFMDE